MDTGLQPGAFALATLSAGAVAFPGLMVDDRVLDLSSPGVLPFPAGSTRVVLEHWESAYPLLAALAEDSTQAWRDLDGLTVLAPVEPGQIFQCGANYRTHVIDLAIAHRAPVTSWTEPSPAWAPNAPAASERVCTRPSYTWLRGTSAHTPLRGSPCASPGRLRLGRSRR
ncbi:hypothetical protein [Cryptosporangium minutisporangium]|uniref:Fumarylacetoacetase-like C-terminal domain-containing protein n=1 Tax=Cryptosporangium minutisporangium TaxID=113569 RepID=A0ABP6T7S4_9ACTN